MRETAVSKTAVSKWPANNNYQKPKLIKVGMTVFSGKLTGAAKVPLRPKPVMQAK